MNKDNLEKIFEFLKQAEKLKSTLRYNETTGGRKESTADHSWRLALMVPIIIKELKMDIDIRRCMEIALVHDLAESITGDIDAVRIAKGEISKEKKYELESEAIRKIESILPDETGEEIYDLWKEYEDSFTKEGKFIKGLDKLETMTQLIEAGYKTYDEPKFIVSYTEQAIKNFPDLKEFLIAGREKLKAEFIKGNIPWK